MQRSHALPIASASLLADGHLLNGKRYGPRLGEAVMTTGANTNADRVRLQVTTTP